MITVKLADGSKKTFQKSPTGKEVAASISSKLAKQSVGFIKSDSSQIYDIRDYINDGDQITILTLNSPQSIEVIRHSAAHVLAQAVQKLWPEVKVTIGPVIDQGFYYDFDTDKKFTPDDLVQIEKQMEKIIKQDLIVEKEVWSSKKACSFFESKKEFLKKEIIKDLNLEEVSLYKQGDWIDLCKGPHVQRLGQIGAVKVLSLSGAYWRGDSKNKQLQRIYGTAFHKPAELKSFLEDRQQAEKNDHRNLGRELDLFWFSELSPGMPFFTGNGAYIYQQLKNFLREKYKEEGYEEVITPQIYFEDLFAKSGHLNFFKENMYASQVEGQPQAYLKPMNCPAHCILYRKDRKSYRDLPWRVADFGSLHRSELKGALQGLTRVRRFCQDDAHIFCRIDQLEEELSKSLVFMQDVYKTLGLRIDEVQLAGKPEKSMGSVELWNQAEEALKSSLKSLNIEFTKTSEGAFYGPKIDVGVKDSFSRTWQLATFQCDFNLPSRFELKYISEQGQQESPVMVHRAILGSIERFIGVYLEHCKGRLPLWLCPTQTLLLPLTDRELEFCKELQKQLAQAGIICKIDGRNEKLSYKIRQAQLLQIPYMLTVGQKELKSQLLSVRLREGEILQLSAEDYCKALQKELKTRSIKSLLSSQG